MNMVDECTSENFSIIQDAKNRDLVKGVLYLLVTVAFVVVFVFFH